jgi:RES domain-containing protein
VLSEVSGVFVKIAFATAADVVLARGVPDRPAARFNKVGQDALYLSPDEESAKVAIGEYVKADDPPRVLLRFDVERCSLFDLRHPSAANVYELARQGWRRALANSVEPASWGAADDIRRSGHVGLIDPSRRRPGLWHITLLRWNEPGAPRVRQLGDPTPIEVSVGFR